VALAFPTVISAPLWILNLRLGDEFALGAVYRAPWSLLSYASFTLLMGQPALPLGGVTAMAVSAGIAAITSYLVFPFNQT
jgi:hypothetical protein